MATETRIDHLKNESFTSNVKESGNTVEVLRQTLIQIRHEKEVSNSIIKAPDGREIFIAVFDSQKAFSDLTAVIGEAHPDDAILGEGINIISSELGVGLTYVTMTDGSARDLDGYATPKDLALQRRQENIEAAEKAGAAMVINLGYKDGELHKNKKEATAELQAVLDTLNPLYMITPNGRDKHKDHVAAYRIARHARKSTDVSLYGTDTQTTKGKWSFPLHPTHYFSVSHAVKLKRDQEYDAHFSQVNVPNRKDVDQVFALTETRGEQKGWKYGGVLFKTRFVKDTLTPLLQDNGIEVKRRNTPQVIYQKTKRKLGLAA